MIKHKICQDCPLNKTCWYAHHDIGGEMVFCRMKKEELKRRKNETKNFNNCS